MNLQRGHRQQLSRFKSLDQQIAKSSLATASELGRERLATVFLGGVHVRPVDGEAKRVFEWNCAVEERFLFTKSRAHPDHQSRRGDFVKTTGDGCNSPRPTMRVNDAIDRGYGTTDELIARTRKTRSKT